MLFATNWVIDVSLDDILKRTKSYVLQKPEAVLWTSHFSYLTCLRNMGLMYVLFWRRSRFISGSILQSPRILFEAMFCCLNFLLSIDGNYCLGTDDWLGSTTATTEHDEADWSIQLVWIERALFLLSLSIGWSTPEKVIRLLIQFENGKGGLSHIYETKIRETIFLLDGG